MTPEQERDAALAALTAPERARAIEREQQAERELAPAERRGLGNLARDVLGEVWAVVRRVAGLG